MDAPEPQPWRHWEGHALVVGAGGIGVALHSLLGELAPGLTLHLSSRTPAAAADLQLDLADDDSLRHLRERASAELRPLRIVINTAGVLHGPVLQPEKRLAAISRPALEQSFAVNAFGPVLLAQALEAALPRELPCHFASLSARVGSIGDNRLGGWYAYRAAKAAQNQLLRTLAI
jgi:NAD(P)-dependent dehydrogenase (short-subunit alcohol dehydrogenase family)